MRHPDAHDLTALAYGLVEGAEKDSLLEHLSECDECRALYDSYMEEQELVREAVVRDGHSAPAEARALERTLALLDEASGARRVVFLRWPVLQAAALVVLAFGVWILLSPPRTRETGSGVVAINEAERAPARIESGVVFVSGDDGSWRQADAVPFDQWVKVGDGEKLSLTLKNGGRAAFSNNAIFRVTLTGSAGNAEDLAVFTILQGDSRIDGDVLVNAGAVNFRPLPGAMLYVNCADPDNDWSSNSLGLRSWNSARQVQALVAVGRALLVPAEQGLNALPLEGGDRVEWVGRKLIARTASGEELPLETPESWNSTVELVVNRLNTMNLYFADADETTNRLFSNSQMNFVRMRQPGQITIAIRESTEADGKRLTLTVGPSVYVLEVEGKEGSQLYRAESGDELHERVPEPLREAYDRLRIQVAQAGRNLVEVKPASEKD